MIIQADPKIYWVYNVFRPENLCISQRRSAPETDLVAAKSVGSYANPVYFTATTMIGMIALAGIATRNAIMLIEFVEKRKKEGKIPLFNGLRIIF